MNNVSSPRTDDAGMEPAIAAVSKAPRVTPGDIAANIISEHYFTAAEGVAGEASLRHGVLVVGDVAPPPAALGLLTFCVLVLRNGFTVTGESACASPENFDAQIGRSIARENAVQKIWPLMGYALKQQLHDQATDFPLGKPCDLSGEGPCEGCQ